MTIMSWFSSSGSKLEATSPHPLAESRDSADSAMKANPGLEDAHARGNTTALEAIVISGAGESANRDPESRVDRFFANMSNEGPSISQASKSTTRSALPVNMANFASQYPFTTIAAIGAMATAVFLGSVGLTARLLRGGPRPHLSPALDKRLEGIEKKMNKLQNMQKRANEGNEATRIAAVEQMQSDGLSEMGFRQSVDMAVQRAMEAREEWEEHVQAARERSMDEIRDEVKELKSISTQIFEAIKLLKDAQAADLAREPQAQMPADGVWSMGELSKMVEDFQAQTMELNAAEKILDSDIDIASEAKSSDEANEVSSSGDKVESAEKTALNRAVHGYDIGAGEEALGVVAEELSKSAKAKKKRQAKKAKTALAAKEDEDWEMVSPEGSASEIGESGGVDFSIAEAESAESKLDQAPQPTLVESSTEPADTQPLRQAPEDALPGRVRKRTALPESEPVVDPIPKDSAARLGVDDSGGWSFSILSVLDGEFPIQTFTPLSVLLTERNQTLQEVQSRQWGQQHMLFTSDEISRQTVAMLAFRNPDIELIELDGSIWRCEAGNDGDYTIVEKLADA